MSWWELCKLCGHALLLHDIEDYEDLNPTCCVGDCGCGKPKLVTR